MTEKLDMENEAPIYVVGFPKSGNTWLLRMLCDICQANIDHGDVINRSGFRADRSRTIHKVHFASVQELQANAKIIYIVRDVRDVVVSGFFHNHRFVPEESVLLENRGGLKSLLVRSYFLHHLRRLNKRWRGNEITEARNLLAALRDGRWPATKKVAPNWSDHVSYWSSLPGICVVRYEDLLGDTVAEMRRILRFLEVDFSDGELCRVIEKESFQNKKREFCQSGDSQNDKFLRKGCAGDWVRFVTEEFAAGIVRENEKGLRIMNYLEDGALAGKGKAGRSGISSGPVRAAREGGTAPPAGATGRTP